MVRRFPWLTLLFVFFFGLVLSTGITDAQQRCTPPPSGMVAWWPGDGNYTDIVGGTQGTPAGGVTFAPGKVGQAFSFNGTDASFSVPSSATPQLGTSDLTVDFWINTTQTTDAVTLIPLLWKTTCFSNDCTGWVVFKRGIVGPGLTGTVDMQICQNFQCQLWGTSRPVDDGQWHHVVLTRSGLTLTAYFDGLEDTGLRGEHPVANGDTDLPLQFGTDTEYGGHYAGQLDEVEIFTRALSLAEIQAIYNAGALGKCKGGIAYVASQSSNSVSVYGINPVTGALTLNSTAAAGTQPSSVAIDPAARFAYVTNQGAGNISAYTVDSSTGTGALTPVAGSPFLTGPGPLSVAVDTTGKFAYVANGLSASVSAYAIDQNTGVLTPLAGSPFLAGMSPSSIAVDPQDRFIYVTNFLSGNVSAYTIDPATGALTPVVGSPFAAGPNPNSVTVGPSGLFVYAANCSDPSCAGAGSVSVYAINPGTGALAPVAGSPFPAGSGANGVAADGTGKFVYVANRGSNNVSAYASDPATGILTAITGSPFLAGSAPMPVAVDPVGDFVYVANSLSSNLSAYNIDQSTGVLTPVSGSPFATGTGPVSIAIANLAPSFPLTVSSLTATTGGNSGSVTDTIVGTGFNQGATPQLVCGSQPPIVGTNATVSPDGTTLTATFSLQGITPGKCDVVVTNPNGTSVTDSQAFTVEQGGAPQLSVDIIGLDKIRIGTEQTYYLVINNGGPVDGLVSFGNVASSTLLTTQSIEIPAVVVPLCTFETPIVDIIPAHSNNIYRGVCQSPSGCSTVT